MRDNDPISDLMSKEGLSYPEAVERLAAGERVRELRAALEGLVDRLEEIHADPAYKSVWTMYYVHGGRYHGPTYVEALARAKAELRRA
jgi:hypothetical protein